MVTFNPVSLAGKTTVFNYNVPLAGYVPKMGSAGNVERWVYRVVDNPAVATLEVINSSGVVIAHWDCKTTTDFGTTQSVWLHFGVDSSVNPVKGNVIWTFIKNSEEFSTHYLL